MSNFSFKGIFYVGIVHLGRDLIIPSDVFQIFTNLKLKPPSEYLQESNITVELSCKVPVNPTFR